VIIERLNQLVKLSLNSNFKIISGDCNFWKYSHFPVDYIMMQLVLVSKIKEGVDGGIISEYTGYGLIRILRNTRHFLSAT